MTGQELGGLKHSRVALNHERELGGMSRGIGGGRMSIHARTHTEDLCVLKYSHTYTPK